MIRLLSAASLSMFLLVGAASAQLATLGAMLEAPEASPAASVSQAIGVTDVSITYHRPGVKDREVYGTRLVPYGGKPYPWRAGANENTVFAVSTDVTINGEPLSAGSYGFHIIPSEDEWILIFSKNDKAWGSFSYTEDMDALRVTVTPTDIPDREWLAYGFDGLTKNSATAYMEWEKKRIEFEVAVDLESTVLASFRQQLTGLAGFSWNANYQAARWCLDNETEFDQALEWIDNSIQWNKNDFNLRTKGEILLKLGRDAEASAVLEEALQLAPEDRKKAIHDLLESHAD